MTDAITGTALIAGKSLPVHADCFPCFLRQTVMALDFETEEGRDNALRFQVLLAVIDDISGADLTRSPAHATSIMHRRIRRMLGTDPYRRIKREYNDKAMALYPSLKQRVKQSPDPLFTATRLAIAGNVIDFGIYVTVDIEGTVERSLEDSIAVDDYLEFQRAINRHSRILYLLDNTGEVVFDRILIEELGAMGKDVIAVAKGGSIINDCTEEDARDVGIHEVARLITNGSDDVGTALESVSPEFLELYNDRDAMVISKGQGNFETLLEEKRRIFFLFQAKCDVLARVLNLQKGSMLLAANRYEDNIS